MCANAAIKLKLITLKYLLLRPLKINKNIGTFSLNQNITKVIDGPIGKTEIIIDSGKVRVSKSPCTKKYCIHQGWINQLHQTIVCVPNKMSISIIGNQSEHDSLNY